jgi:prepilin-type N-terminal cleavage/methylation domain-containing protein
MKQAGLPRRSEAKAGFTLIELLLVVGLLAISVGVTSDILLSLVRSYTKTQVTSEIEQQSNFVSLKLKKELRNSTAITFPEADGSDLLVFQKVTDTGAVTVIYAVTGGILYRSEDNFDPIAHTNGSEFVSSVGDDAIPLTGGLLNVSCSGSCFELGTTSSPQYLTLSLVFTQGGGGSAAFSGDVRVEDTVVLRNSY